MVSTKSKSRAALDQERPHSAADISRLHLIEGDHPKASVVGVGRVGQRDRERSDRARHVATFPVGAAHAVGPLSALARGLLVDLPGQLVGGKNRR